MAEDIFLQKRIYDWSLTLPTWQRALMRQLCAGPLTAKARNEILAVLCRDPDAPTLEMLELTQLPADEAGHGVVELREIRNLRNVNRLAADETLRFGPGLNIVFGENGTGKSGYGRLCRRVCRAAVPGEVLRDVFDPGIADAPQTAEFVLSIDGQAQTVEVDLEGDAPRVLSAMTAFDASCAQVYISKSNAIEHTPRSLRLLKELCDAQDELAQTLTDRIAEFRKRLPSLPAVAEKTTAGKLLERVARGEATADEIRDLARLTEDDITELKRLIRDEAAIKSDQSAVLEKAARAKAAAAERLLADVSSAWKLLDDTQLDEIKAARVKLDSATTAAIKAAEDAFNNQPIPGTGGDAWREMWNAARRFIEAGGEEFPNLAEDANCPLCQQHVEATARERMERFERFVAGDLRTRVRTLEEELAGRLRQLPDVEQLARTATASLADAPDELRDAVLAAMTTLGNRKSIALGTSNAPVPSPLELSVIREYIAARASDAERHASLRNIDQQARIADRLVELRGREILAGSLDDVLAHIAGLKTIRQWENIGKELRTQAISRKIGEFSKLAITNRLREALKREIEELDPIADRIELNDAASKGKPTVQFKLQGETRERIPRVLSTGEQMALATAFFLAELSVTNELSAIMLDDPVSSLDHQRREHVAARLVDEAQDRQVVVFTHDVVFVHYLKEIANEAQCELHGQTLIRANHQVGVIDAELPWAVKSPQNRLSTLRHALNHVLRPMFQREDPQYARAVHQWALDLRKGYERLIESYVLGGAVERHARNIRVRNLHKVRWTPDLAHRIDAAMKEVSAFAHDEPLSQHSAPPRPEKLEVVLVKFEEMCDETKPDSNSTADKVGDMAGVATDISA